MKAAYYDRNGGPEVFRYGEVDDPRPGPGEVLIRVGAISIEGGDVLGRRMGPPASPRHVVGYQAAGTVAALGEGVASVAVGQRVVGHAAHGSHAELFVVPEAFAFPIPDGLDLDVAATAVVTFATAHDALFEFGGLRAGETVLVQGAAGGVGIACVQLARRAGATVIAVARGQARLERLAALGADHGIDPGEQDVGERTRAITGGRGADLVVDMVGGAGFPRLLDAAAYRARVALVGASSGGFQSVSFRDLIARNLTVIGVYLAHEIGGARIHAVMDGILADLRDGTLAMPIDAVFPLADAAKAHAHVETGRPFGRVLMHP